MKHYELKYEFTRLRFLGLNLDFSSGYFYNPKDRQIIEFNISRNQETLRLFQNLRNYVGLPSRHEKYLKVYRIFELLGGKPSIAWRAIRVSISHSPKKVTEKKLVNYLLSNFGELDISFKNRHQISLFYEVFTELVEATYSEILSGLTGPIIVEADKGKKIITILDSMRSEYSKESKHSRMYHYRDLESKLKECIPNRLINPYVPWK